MNTYDMVMSGKCDNNIRFTDFRNLYCTSVKFTACPDCRPPARRLSGCVTVNPCGLQYNSFVWISGTDLRRSLYL